MSFRFLFTLLSSLPYPAFPNLWGWVAWLVLLGMLIYSLYRWRQTQPAWKPSSWGLFVLFLILVPFANLFIGLRLSSPGLLPLPNLPADPPGSAMMLFSAIPWTLAGALLGPLGAAIVGALAGVLRGVWDTYNFFTALEFALLGAWFAFNTRQRFRTWAFRLLRQPLVSALILIPFHAIFYVVAAFFTLAATATARLDFALSNVGVSTLAFSGEMLVAGLVVQIVSVAFPLAIGGKQPLQPSPTERSLETRFVFGTGTFVLVLLLTLLIGDWQVAGKAARNMLEDRMSSTAQAAAQSVPFFLETGQNLVGQIATDPRLAQLTDPELSTLLGQQIQTVPYFDQIFLLNLKSRTLLAGYPPDARAKFSLFSEEETGLQLADSGVSRQIYSIPSAEQGASARVSFLALVQGANGAPWILIGRTSLETNPLTEPLLNSLNSLSELNGDGILLDENNRILYHSSSTQALTTYNGPHGETTGLQENTASDGTRQLTYYQPVIGRPWAIVLTIPAQQAQQLALNIALPLSVMIFLLAIVALVFLRVGLRVVTGSLQNLATEANRIAQGTLDHPLQVEGADEVSQLRRAFEQMRASLKARLEELNRLLFVSQGVASSLEMEDAVKPVLEAILATGASCVRLVLEPDTLPDIPVQMPSSFAVGATRDAYAHLDEQVLELAQTQTQIVIPNLARSRDLALNHSMKNPVALLAVALRHENRYYGVVWAGYDQLRGFSESDVGFIRTLAGQASLAVANAHLFLNVEASRRQLEAILNSTPDPVLVTDHRNRLLLANRAAVQALTLKPDYGAGQPTEKVIQQRALFDLLQASADEKQSAEIVLPDHRTYFATASSVTVEGHAVGRVCILRDVTYFKELDQMKSDFVATVSHDLRSPLTLMRGYATMLDMVGALNEQQQGYVKKIISGVESMSRLVNNLLDLGRIEVGVGLEVEDVSVSGVLERVIGPLQHQAEQKNITLDVELPRDLPSTVQADSALLQQAVYNLVENAIKYTPAGGRVVVGVRSVSNMLVFRIADSGIGIPADDIPRLFEKFYRSPQREARAQQGTGLGLAIVHSIAERHGGKVWVESELGKGSVFFLQIPLTQVKDTLAT
ncbi:MAG TPA: ATP-binding protein [Anaerolineales bacterium]|nr:ATP-binding protein [Anaerolineales bacterium]